MLDLAQQRQRSPEEVIHRFLVADEQARYTHANQQMLAQGILASIPTTLCGAKAAFTPVALPGPPLLRTILNDRW